MSKVINVIGLGYIGLPTALMLAANNLEVIGTDYNNDLVDSLNNGVLTFKEDGLTDLFGKALVNGIKFTPNYIHADIYIIAVPTPYDKFLRKIDNTYVVSALKEILKVCSSGAIVIIESTIAPGTIDNILKPIAKEQRMVVGKDIHFVHAPERIIPGNMVFELINNSRTIGADSRDIAEIVKHIYASFCRSEILITDIKTAEMSKVVENTYRDINIAFANELAKICNDGNMDVYEVIRVANKHPRVNILQPGPGVGGHCISVDPWFLVGEFPDLAKLIYTSRLVNDSMPSYVLSKIQYIMTQSNIKDFSRLGIYGITYKENVDDTRESPTLQLISQMNKSGIQGYRLFDPLLLSKRFDNQFMDFDEFLSNIDIIVIMVGHNHIKLNYEKVKNLVILDTRNIFNSSSTYKL